MMHYTSNTTMNKRNPNFPSSSSSSGSYDHPHHHAQTLDPNIWSRLPLPLFDRILHFLPPPSFFRLQTLSRHTHSLLFSPSFLHSHHLLSPHRPSFAFFPTSSPSALFLLDPVELSWHRLPLSALLPSTTPLTPAASSGGLICFLSLPPGPKTLILVNPVSKLTAYLPQTLTPRFSPAVGLCVGPSFLSAVITGDDLVSSFSVKNLSSELFFADAAAPLAMFSPWSIAGALPRLCSIEPSRMVFGRGKFYCMSVSPFAVLTFDQVSNSWSKIQPPMRRFLRCPNLVELGINGSEVGLVATVEKNRLNVPRSVRIWRLESRGDDQTLWVEIARMPADVHERFNGVGNEFDCAGCGGMVAFLLPGVNSDVVLFDVQRREWKWAPACPYWHEGGLKVFGYEPRITVPAMGLLAIAS